MIFEVFSITIPAYMAHKNRTNTSPMKPRGPAKGARGGKHRRPRETFSKSEATDRFFDHFRHHGFSHLSPSTLVKLVDFYFLLMDEQQHNNFTRLITLKDVAIKHFIDCLIVPQLTDLQFPLLDIGTGPGFPGIPLKILFPGERIILAEGVQKRVEFLKKVRDQLELPNLDIVGRNIDETFHLPVRGAITRAVEDIRNTLHNVTGCMPSGGRVYLMKGPNVDPEIPQAKKEMGNLYQLILDKAYTLPETPHQRRLLVYERNSTPKPASKPSDPSAKQAKTNSMTNVKTHGDH